MANRRMLLNSTEESFIGTMRIEYSYDGGKLPLVLNNNIKIIEESFDDDSDGYYIVGFKKDLIVPKDFIDYRGYCEIEFYSDYNITFDRLSIYAPYLYFHGNFTFNGQSITSENITLYDYNYTFNGDCFDLYSDYSYILFYGKTRQQYYNNINSYKIYARSHILYDLMKYNNIEEGDEKAQDYIPEVYANILIVSSPTEYIKTIPNVDLGNNNYIRSVNNYMYNGNYITEYVCNSAITHLRKGITLPQDATVYFPDTVTSIDSDTFENERNLKKVVIFGNCKLTYLNGFADSSLETIEIYNNKIERIEESCFYDCDNLHNITIPKSVKYIESYAFDHLGDGFNFVINYKGTKQDWSDIYLIDEWYGDTTDIIVNCTDDSFVVNPYKLCIIYYTSTDSNIIDVNTEYINSELLYNDNYGGGNKNRLIFKDGINNISLLFKDKTQLTEVWLPNYNILYTESAFNGCTNLTVVNNSKQLKGIDRYTFLDCINLQQIEIDSLWISNSAFSDCTSLNYVKISKTIERIYNYAFGNCTSLESIDYEGTIEEWNSIDIEIYWRDGSAITTIHCSDGDIQL